MRARRSASGKALVARRYADTSVARRRSRRWTAAAAAATIPVAISRSVYTTLTHARALSFSRDGSPRRYARANRIGGRPCRSVRRPVPHRRVHPPTSCRRALAFAARGLRITAAAAVVRGTQVSGRSCRRRRRRRCYSCAARRPYFYF